MSGMIDKAEVGGFCTPHAFMVTDVPPDGLRADDIIVGMCIEEAGCTEDDLCYEVKNDAVYLYFKRTESGIEAAKRFWGKA